MPRLPILFRVRNINIPIIQKIQNSRLPKTKFYKFY